MCLTCAHTASSSSIDPPSDTDTPRGRRPTELEDCPADCVKHPPASMPPAQSLQSSRLTLSETSIGSFKRRKRKSIIVLVLLLIVSVLILIFGLAATTRTQNITVGGYYPGVILGFGSFLGIIGAHLIENKRQMLVASMVFISFGVVAAFCCAIVDGVFAARHIDLRPLYAGRCEYHSSDTSPERDVSCQTSSRISCNLRVKGNTCYCCDLYTCGNRVEMMGGYHEYTDVKSCQDVVHLYHLLWSATILNIIALFLGIITAAVLGGFKDLIPSAASESTSEPEAITAPVHPQPPPATTTINNSYYNTAPCLPPYTAYDLQGSCLFPDSSGLSDDSQSGASHLWPTMIPPRYSPPHNHPDDKPPPYSP
ncbi:transmembrane protein 255A isoform X4 [Anarrhichthys ocellatus]|uniref:transmembrane protein 255A isoform X4 n=1 Tax=Anarrhichthys ocellatus TaxID=433405 RepID=UPI0012EE4A8D|nr:transmembrane protein 255A isoform X4 [Anarrhichthys ocellatus]